MIQWTIRKTISVMGAVYVFLDKFLKHDVTEVLNTPIDLDFQNMSRKELCNYVEDKFNWERNAFWDLESTQKIRICCQIARNNKFSVGEKK
tara:strand:- start:1480 stop:1752 length:273 start_codon:yes stop_codon:yes gene_type:complete